MRRRGAYEAAALDHARRESPGRLRPAARLLAQRFDPVPSQERHTSQPPRVASGSMTVTTAWQIWSSAAPRPSRTAPDRAARIARAVIDAREKPDANHAEGARDCGEAPASDVRTLSQVQRRAGRS
jgi:hypothetical protein